jgi:hypothetical protein
VTFASDPPEVKKEKKGKSKNVTNPNEYDKIHPYHMNISDRLRIRAVKTVSEKKPKGGSLPEIRSD